MFLISYYCLPHEFGGIFTANPTRISKNWHLAVSVTAGLWGGLVIGVSTEYYTSNRYQPTKVRSSLFRKCMDMLGVGSSSTICCMGPRQRELSLHANVKFSTQLQLQHFGNGRDLLCMQTVAEACRTGASTNIIFGLALGYQSCIVPTIVLAVIIYIAFTLANMYGVACAALGMLGTLATGAHSWLHLITSTADLELSCFRNEDVHCVR